MSFDGPLFPLWCKLPEALASALNRMDESVEVRVVDLMEPPYAAVALR